MTDEEIDHIYKVIVRNYKKYLITKGVKLPKLRNIDSTYTKDALVLIRLAQGFPKTKPVSKRDLTNFVKAYYPDITDVQQARHLSMQKGWNILSSTRGDLGVDFPKNSYRLMDLQNSYPAFTSNRRDGFRGDFKELKKKYGYRCATCGSIEGREHLFRKGVTVKLQEGHMDPLKPLQEGNIFPQCQICNRADRNRWIYDKTGRVIEVAETPDGIRIIETFLQKASREVKTKISIFLTKLLTGK